MRHSTDLKVLLSNNPQAAVSTFDSLVQKEENEATIQELCQIMANYIRHSSVFKRRMMSLWIQRCSFLSRLYLSFQFHSFNDTMFPRRFIFQDTSLSEISTEENPHRRHHVTAVGSNRYFNLGVQSDGSPVDEPRLVCVPPALAKIKMTNTHTVFLTVDNRLFGCGKASSFLPECKAGSGYVALPSQIEIPGTSPNDVVSDVRVTEGGSEFLIREKWYHIGKSFPLHGFEQIASNCVVSNGTLGIPPLTYQSANVSFSNSHVKIYMKLIDNILFWDRSSSFNARKEVSLVVNGWSAQAAFSYFQVLDDGTIYGTEDGLLKGKLEFWKNLDDGFTVKNGTEMEHFDTKYTLMALMEEVPGSIGTEFFAVSPDGLNLITKVGYVKEGRASKCERKYKSLHVHQILLDRKQEHDPVEIPEDLTLIFHCRNGNVVDFKTNELVFKMMFPDLTGHIKDKEMQFPFVDPPGFRLEGEVDLQELAFGLDLYHPRHLPNPTDPSFEFVPQGTASDMIWHLVTAEKSRIPCHKYLLLLHSRRIAGMQRFQSNLSFGAYQPADSEQKPVEIMADANATIVRNALRGILNPATLFDLKTIELIECINFYDYHLMNEMFEDSMYVLMETINDYTLPLLYELFYSFDKDVVEGLLKRKHLLFDSISPVLPPRELLLQFVENVPKCREQSHIVSDTYYYEPECLVRYFIDLDQDFEDSIFSLVHSEFGGVLDSWMKTAARRKEENKKTRSRNNSHTYRPESSETVKVTTPITIGGAPIRNSLSESLSSPVQSPLTFSMSPLTKSIPIARQRSNSISNSFEDFPEIGSPSTTSTSTPCKIKPAGGRFAPKGARFVKANQMLKPSPVANPWKATSSAIQEEGKPWNLVNFNEVVHKEEKLQRNIKTGFKKVRRLQDIQMEQTAAVEILEYYRRGFEHESLVCVELVRTNDLEIESEQIVWGNMPGLIRR